MKKVLITGGAGFLGLHLARYFSKKKYIVRILDLQPIQRDEYPDGVEYIRGDVRDARTVARAVKGMHLVIHAAAALPLWKAEDIYSTNVQGTKIVLEQSSKHKVAQVIYISSTAVYGVPKRHPIREVDPLVGVGPYGESKIAAERLCEGYRNDRMIVTVIRPKTFIGTHRLGVFEILFDWIKDGKRIPVFGSGNNRYQLLDVDDLVEAIYRCTVVGRKAQDTFHIGAARYSTVQNDLGKLFTYANSGSRIFPVPALPLKLALRIFEFFHLSPLYKWVYETADKDSYVSLQKMKRILRWTPKHSNAEALIKSYRWYQRHYTAVKSRTTGITHTTGWNQGILGFFKRFL